MPETTAPTTAHEPGPKPKFLVVEDILYYQSKAGDELKFDLDFPNDVFEKLQDPDEGVSERDQFLVVMDALGGTKMIDRIKQMGALEQSRLISRFFVEFSKAAEATPGESVSSSDS